MRVRGGANVAQGGNHNRDPFRDPASPKDSLTDSAELGLSSLLRLLPRGAVSPW